jgi:thiol:disulfide interchange protein DsbA
MKRILLALAALVLAAQAPAATWEAGKHYEVLDQPQRTNVAPGKVEVLEVFSYGCPHCDRFQSTMAKLKSALPANVQFSYIPASWNPSEGWPLFQRAYLTAQSMGVAEKGHAEMFNAVWHTGELAVLDLKTNELKRTLPTIEDVAKLYGRVAGVKPAEFVSTSKSFGVDMKMRAADAQVLAMKVTATPTLVINGKYKVINEGLKTNDELVDLVKFLVAKEAPAAASAAPAKKS